MQKADQYCAEKATRSGSSFYYSFLFLPPEKRKALTALYAFCRVVDDCVDECTEPSVAAQTLAWWQQEIDRVFEGRPEHPIGIALYEAHRRFNLQKQLFEQILKGMQMDLQYQGYESFEDLKLYCHCVASATGLLAAQIFGFQDAKTLEYAKQLGIAFQLVNIIRDVGEDARRGRIYLPTLELAQFGVQERAIFGGHYSDHFEALMRFQATRARQYYQEALQALTPGDRYAQRSGLIMAAIYFRLLDTIEKNHFKVLHQKISLTPLCKLWTAWKTARRIPKSIAES